MRSFAFWAGVPFGIGIVVLAGRLFGLPGAIIACGAVCALRLLAEVLSNRRSWKRVQRNLFDSHERLDVALHNLHESR